MKYLVMEKTEKVMENHGIFFNLKIMNLVTVHLLWLENNQPEWNNIIIENINNLYVIMAYHCCFSWIRWRSWIPWLQENPSYNGKRNYSIYTKVTSITDLTTFELKNLKLQTMPPPSLSAVIQRLKGELVWD